MRVMRGGYEGGWWGWVMRVGMRQVRCCLGWFKEKGVH